VLGRLYVLVHDQQLAHDILFKQSAKSSERPWAEFAFSMCGLNEFMAAPYDGDFRFRRKLMHQQLGTAKLVAEFDDIQQAEAKRFLMRVLDRPDATLKHLQQLVWHPCKKTQNSVANLVLLLFSYSTMATIILSMTYGYSVGQESGDPLVKLIERMTENLVKATAPWPVDFIPALKFLPEWLPGARFKRSARSWKKINLSVVNIPYFFTRKQMEHGTHRPSYVSRLVESYQGNKTDSQLDANDEAAIKRTAAAMYVGGADTTVTVLTTLIMAMMLFPEAQRRAQQEIDDLVGSEGRLPTMADKMNLPYTAAMVKECFRWSPVAPMGIPHAMSADAICGGYLVPKGAVVIPMIWWFLHDPAMYATPDLFQPERYLEPRNEPDPTIIFGYGRRVCPGRYFAEANVFLMASQLLACFNIRKRTDARGVEIEPVLDVLPGLHSHLKEFAYRVEPRSAKHAEMIRRAQHGDHDAQSGDSVLLGVAAVDTIKECLAD
jgi:hypothetical protein